MIAANKTNSNEQFDFFKSLFLLVLFVLFVAKK